jgi:potassium-transporting ATPase potassium-binding subunit
MWFLPAALIIFTLIVAIPLSKYIAWIMEGKYHPRAVFGWVEKRLDTGPMNWKQYAAALLIFNTVLFVWGFIVLSVQALMPLNDLHRGMLFPTTIFNSVVSFVTNTNLQHYSGDQHFSNFSQIFFCVANYFLSASVGFCSLAAIIRLFRKDRRRATISSICGG